MSKISLVIPVYNEEENIPFLYERLCALREKMLPDSIEVLLVDDHSTDRSFPLLKEIARKDADIKVIRFSKNFGSHVACYAGLVHSSGDACSFISADLQDPPEFIETLIVKWKEGYRIVLGVRDESREAGIFEKIITMLYTFLMRRFAIAGMPKRSTDVFLIDRQVVDFVRSVKEKNPNIFGLILWSGFNQVEIPYKKAARQFGKSKWNFAKKVKIFIDSFVSFSYFPIRLMSVSGMGVAFIGFFYAIVVIFNRLFYAKPIEGWTSLMVVLLVVSGIQMLMLGVLGEYLWRNFDESRNRPSFIISDIIGFRDSDEQIG